MRRRLSLQLLTPFVLMGCSAHDVHPIRAEDSAIVGDGSPTTDATDGGLPKGPCLSQSDCSAGDVCTFPEGLCMAATTARCGLPPPPYTSPFMRKLGEKCTFPASGYTLPACQPPCEGYSCEASLVCVPNLWAMHPRAEYQAIAGLCLHGCDPCADDSGCWEGQDCYAMANGGGFCHPSPLPQVGKASILSICAMRPARSLPVAGLTCAQYCRPDDSSRDLNYTYAGTSADCLSGEICTGHWSSLGDWDSFVCRTGSLTPWGTLCYQDSGACPVSCASLDPGAAICTPYCDQEPCPDGLDCFEIVNNTTTSSLCIHDGVIPYGRLCAEDRNCQAGLRCTPHELIPEQRTCTL
ncbi:MAG: hypothetical protein JRH20_08610 [Deltaproteobacteria bacterium]|nr:hypothetical protein [Deltaproteobacteria bacterium]